MEAENKVLQHYESIADVSAQMLAAARSADWDGLIAAEKECAQLILRLKAARADIPLGTEGNKRRFALIRTVLAHDAEIRRLTQPWLVQLERFLNTAATDRRLSEAYR